MKFHRLSSFLLLLSVPLLARADGVADFARAQLMFAQVMNGIQQYKQVAATTASATNTPAEPAAPEPLTDKSGKFCLPYDENGNLVEWANKALAANVGAAVGAKAGEKAGTMAASKIPFAGGLIAMGAKKKGKELGALAAVGGAKFVKESSTLSFNSLEEMSLYMHLHFSANTDYIKGLAAAIAIYPDLYKTYESSVKKAYAAR
jgi:hypothetical protein